MNAENFTKYLENPTMLYQVSYQEIKSLVLRYPYCTNLRVMLLLKSKLENHKDFERNLNMAAISSGDRAYLYDLLHQQEMLKEETEEVLELKDISDLVKERENYPSSIELEIATNEASEFLSKRKIFLENLKKREAAYQAKYTNKNEVFIREDKIDGCFSPGRIEEAGEDTPIRIEELLDDTEYEEEENWDDFLEDIEEEDVDADLEDEEDWEEDTEEDTSQTIIAVVSVDDERLSNPITPPSSDTTEIFVVNKEELPQPIPKKSFKSWANIHKEEPTDELQEDNSFRYVQAIADKSLEEQEDIASETLAKLLIEQGKYEKAIEVYERLSLIFPKKSTFFAEQIQAAKAKIEDG